MNETDNIEGTSSTLQPTTADVSTQVDPLLETGPWNLFTDQEREQQYFGDQKWWIASRISNTKF